MNSLSLFSLEIFHQVYSNSLSPVWIHYSLIDFSMDTIGFPFPVIGKESSSPLHWVNSPLSHSFLVYFLILANQILHCIPGGKKKERERLIFRNLSLKSLVEIHFKSEFWHCFKFFCGGSTDLPIPYFGL